MRRRELLAALGGVGLTSTTAAETAAAEESGASADEPKTGFLERRRRELILAGAIITLGGLGLLAYKIRTADPDTLAAEQVDEKLERQDLMQGGEANNLLERIIKVGNTPLAYAVVIVGLFTLGTVLALLGLRSQFAVASFAFVLFAMMAFLRFGWPYIEGYLDGGDPAPVRPDSLRVRGFTTDSKVFLTLFVVILLLLFLGILVESSL